MLRSNQGIPSLQLRQNAAKDTLQQISQLDYEHFLRQQTHQLKRLLQTIRSTRRTTSSCTNTIDPPTCRSRLNYQTIIEFTDQDLRAMTADHTCNRAKRDAPATLRKPAPVRSPREVRLKFTPEYYKQRRKEIEDSLYVGGRGYQTVRNVGKLTPGLPTKQSATSRRHLTGKDLAYRLQMSLRKHNKERYTITPSR